MHKNILKKIVLMVPRQAFGFSRLKSKFKAQIASEIKFRPAESNRSRLDGAKTEGKEIEICM